MQLPHRRGLPVVRRSMVATLVGLVFSLGLAACGGSASPSHHNPPPASHNSVTSTSCPIPQNGGGDADGDNSGGPSDGDGCM